ncbi:hypothetical protein C8T65DRAFT_743669 [Cerioporus squamosus]|nr:hypothetical protein C8T65DRAFT_743669 [Cerioporus squamosus]
MTEVPLSHQWLGRSFITLAAFDPSDTIGEVNHGRASLRVTRLPSADPNITPEGLAIRVQGLDREYMLTIPLSLERVRASKHDVQPFWHGFFATDLYNELTGYQLRALINAVGNLLHFSTAGDSPSTRALWDEFHVLAVIAADDTLLPRPEDCHEKLLVPLLIWTLLRNPGSLRLPEASIQRAWASSDACAVEEKHDGPEANVRRP